MDPKDRIWRISRSKLFCWKRGLFGIPVFFVLLSYAHMASTTHTGPVRTCWKRRLVPLNFSKLENSRTYPKSTRNLCFEWESIKIVRTLSFKFPWTFAMEKPYASTSCRLQNSRASYGARIPLGWRHPSCLTPGKNPFRKECTQQMPTIRCIWAWLLRGPPFQGVEAPTIFPMTPRKKSDQPGLPGNTHHTSTRLHKLWQSYRT